MLTVLGVNFHSMLFLTPCDLGGPTGGGIGVLTGDPHPKHKEYPTICRGQILFISGYHYYTVYIGSHLCYQFCLLHSPSTYFSHDQTCACAVKTLVNWGRSTSCPPLTLYTNNRWRCITRQAAPPSVRLRVSQGGRLTPLLSPPNLHTK